MSEPSIEDIANEIEAVMAGLPPSQPKAFAGLSDDERRLVLELPVARALIASWRERGEALLELHEYAASVWFDEAVATDEERELMSRARAALKDKP